MFFCGLLLAATSLVWAGDSEDALKRIQALTRGGATDLALRLLDAQQPKPEQAEVWQQWERERYVLYRVRQDWPALAARVDALPAGAPAEFLRWARTEAAQARLDANDPTGARRVLRQLLWSGEGSVTDHQLWRQLVIRSYLLEDRVDDALLAVERYRDEYKVSAPAWRLLEATTLVRAGRAREAHTRLADLKTHDGQWLTLVAGLRAQTLKPTTVLTRARKLAEETSNRPAIQFQVWLLADEAARRAEKPAERVYALERALTLARAQRRPDQLLAVSADDLWQAYLQLAEQLGNDARLLMGDDEAWFRKARATKRDDAIEARALHALLLQRSESPETRALAAQRLADSLIEDGRNEVLRALFAEGSAFAGVETIPAAVRHRLAAQALEEYDIRLAAKLLKGLVQPPEGEPPEQWTLRRARIAIYAGDYPVAVELMQGLLNEPGKLDDEFVERLLQVLFDLQAAGRHVEALTLLQTLHERSDNPRTRREILYWMAESHGARNKHQQAAELFLRSAYEEHPTGGDPWGQTARYHAAEALGKAGLTRDARLVFQALLKHTEDRKQRAVIERSIQQLWLIENRTTTR